MFLRYNSAIFSYTLERHAHRTFLCFISFGQVLILFKVLYVKKKNLKCENIFVCDSTVYKLRVNLLFPKLDKQEQISLLVALVCCLLFNGSFKNWV